MSEAILPSTQLHAPKRSGSFRGALKSQFCVLHALILHDIKSRFFGNGLGYIVTIIWPAAHVALLLGIYILTGRRAPYGDSNLLYVSLSVLPYIAFSYISRFTLIGVMQNKSYLAYPVINPLDLMMARQLLEIVTITIITIGLILVLIFCHVDVMPQRPDQAALALLSAVLLGIGFGIFNGVMVMITSFWILVYVLVLIIFWLTSGLAINAETMPTAIGDLLAWNPLLDCIEWMRSAYYDDFPTRLLSKSYVLCVGTGALVLGLVMERLLRKFTLR